MAARRPRVHVEIVESDSQDELPPQRKEKKCIFLCDCPRHEDRPWVVPRSTYYQHQREQARLAAEAARQLENQESNSDNQSNSDSDSDYENDAAIAHRREFFPPLPQRNPAREQQLPPPAPDCLQHPRDRLAPRNPPRLSSPPNVPRQR